jgi:hypothetical protein
MEAEDANCASKGDNDLCDRYGPSGHGLRERSLFARDRGDVDGPCRQREQGIVDLEFSIDGQGHVSEVKETFAVSRGLGDSAASQLRDGVFRVPPDWVQTGSDKLRFAIEYQFKLLGHGSHCPTPEAAPRITGAKVVAICSALPGR